jgi:hypothetical protein
MGSTATIGLVASLGQATVGAVASLQQARAQRARARIEARATKSRQDVAQFQAEDARKRGRTEELQRERAGRVTIAQQRAGFAAQGVDISTGTPAELQRQEAAITAVDAATIRANAYREALGYQLTGSRLEQQKAITKAAGRSAARTTLLTGGVSFIRGARAAFVEKRKGEGE